MSRLESTASSAAPVAHPADHWIEELEDGSHVLVRPLRADDREREIEFIRNLSPESRHLRFLCALKEVSPSLIEQLMDVDHHQREVFVALAHRDGELIEVGVSRYAATEVPGECECAVTVADEWRGRGLGVILMRHLIDAARENGFKRIYSVDSAANTRIQTIARALDFRCRRDPEDATQLIHSLEL